MKGVRPRELTTLSRLSDGAQMRTIQKAVSQFRTILKDAFPKTFSEHQK